MAEDAAYNAHADNSRQMEQRWESHLDSAMATRVGGSGSGAKDKGRASDRAADIATSGLVLDKRTRMTLYRMLNRGILSSLHGCVSAGKEAAVFHARDQENQPVAVKIFATSTMTFKRREKVSVRRERAAMGS